MKEETGNAEPAPRESISKKNFEAEKNICRHRIRVVEEEEKKDRQRKNDYEMFSNAMAEYGDLRIHEGYEPVDRVAEMSAEDMKEHQGRLRRDYKKLNEDMRSCRDRIFERLGEIKLMQEFSDNYYLRPLEAMIKLIDNPQGLIRQINTTIRSYDELMKKIEVDISVVEREREEISGQFFDYVRDIHEEMSKIDKNSTINVREKPVKMLKLILPQWAENTEVYSLRLREYMQEITDHAVEMLQKNEAIPDYLGTKINTRMLYDTIVGISNIQIQLYKIEKQKGYPITWADVSKNSGGEGFLSAFVILTSLLTYTRRDDSDIFSDKHEGKVLLMDNPFASTNAEHLLKPMMEMAKKNRTQLICFTGLGGDSIYGRFDNIYVLNLVSSGLKRDLLYLHTDHVRGAEPDHMVMSQIEVAEQLSLF